MVPQRTMPQGTLPGHPGMSVQRSNRHLISGATNRKSDRFGFVNLLSLAHDPTYHTSASRLEAYLVVLIIQIPTFDVRFRAVNLHQEQSGPALAAATL